MAQVEAVERVKLLVALLWADARSRNAALEQMEIRWGAIDFSGSDHPFDVTDYYQAEMGPSLRRRLVSFSRMIPPETLPEVKLACNRIEEQLARHGRRRVNLDAGYLDHSKVVLASMKFAGQKIHLGQGVYADLMSRYRKGRYRPLEWAFPDFRDGRYDRDLARIRELYMEQRRIRRGGFPTAPCSAGL
ncbi:MAG: DUF4416 family protein [Candidatus Aminicenantes bacterium]|nr:DUF4416 family protein [Candidatus Aminicenantes bacterium]